MKKVLVVVDVQKDFVDGALGTKEAQEMLPRLLEKLLQNAKTHEYDLIFTRDTHGEDYLSTQEGRKLPVPHCIKGTPGHELSLELIRYANGNPVIDKPTFGSTELMPLLKDYERLEFVGLCTDICVISNALLAKAFYPEKIVAVDSACCAGVTPESHKNALEAMKMCQVEIM